MLTGKFSGQLLNNVPRNLAVLVVCRARPGSALAQTLGVINRPLDLNWGDFGACREKNRSCECHSYLEPTFLFLKTCASH